MKNKIEKIKVASNKETIEINIIMEKKPYATLNGNTYTAIMPGEELKHEAIKKPMPLPKNMYGFIVNDLIIIKSGGSYKILNPGYTVYKLETKKKNIITTIIGAAILLTILIVGIIYTAKG